MRTLQTLASAALAIALTVQSADSVAYTVDTTPTSPQTLNGLWWNPSESGWGVSLTQQGNVIFVAMFTYDAARNPIWYVASNCAISAGGCTGDLYQVTGGIQPTTAWAGAAVSVARVGTISFLFSDVNDGSASFVINGVTGFKTITRQIFGPQPVIANDNLTKTQQLVGGTWTYVYTILTVFSDSYTFTSVSGPDSSGTYFAAGTDQFGGPVAGAYYASTASWSVLDPGIIIDEFFSFTFSDLNHVSGCYYQISPPGSTNFSKCYPMSGTRYPPKAEAATLFQNREEKERAQLEDAGSGPYGPPEPDLLAGYLRLRAAMRR